jgi:hypothetical protein
MTGLKFRLIITLFDIIIAFFLTLVLIIPKMTLGTGGDFDFLSVFWPLAGVLLVIAGGVNGFFFANRRLFYLLEGEDWPNLATYLEGRLFKKGRYSSRLVKLLANTYLLLSDTAAVAELENRTAAFKPALVETHALVFGLARLLRREYADAARFFDIHGKGSWERWYHGFALFLDYRYQDAAARFIEIATKSQPGTGDSVCGRGRLPAGDPVLIGLSAYLLDLLRRFLPDRAAELAAAAEEGRSRVLAVLPARAAWDREISKIKDEVYAAVLSQYLAKTSQWLYREEGTI